MAILYEINLWLAHTHLRVVNRCYRSPIGPAQAIGKTYRNETLEKKLKNARNVEDKLSEKLENFKKF